MVSRSARVFTLAWQAAHFSTCTAKVWTLWQSVHLLTRVRVHVLAVVLLAVILIGALRGIAEQRRASGEVVHVLEGQSGSLAVGLQDHFVIRLGLGGCNGIVHRHRRLAALVALEAQVGIDRLSELPLSSFSVLKVNVLPLGNGTEVTAQAVREVAGVMAGRAREAIGDGCATIPVIWTPDGVTTTVPSLWMNSGRPVGAVALGATGRTLSPVPSPSQWRNGSVSPAK